MCSIREHGTVDRIQVLCWFVWSLSGNVGRRFNIRFDRTREERLVDESVRNGTVVRYAFVVGLVGSATNISVKVQ